MMRPCAVCGELSERTYCDACQPPLPAKRTDTGEQQWKQLSRRARRLQPFCSVCGSTRNLQLDHSPRAWARRDAGLAIRLSDVTVLCGRCNNAAGSSRAGSRRYVEWEQLDGDLAATTKDAGLESLGGGASRAASHGRPVAKFESQIGRAR